MDLVLQRQGIPQDSIDGFGLLEHALTSTIQQVSLQQQASHQSDDHLSHSALLPAQWNCAITPTILRIIHYIYKPILL
jgi:hypothetical protein